MNKSPTLVSTHHVPLGFSIEMNGAFPLIKEYGAPIFNCALKLITEEWDTRKQEPLTMEIYTGFDDRFNVHKFAYGFSLKKEDQRFRQATIVELLALGAFDQKLGLDQFIYALGSAQIDPKERGACGMVDPMIFYPGLESMDDKRQMLTRAICWPWSVSTHVALVKL